MRDETRLGNLEVLTEVNPYWYKLAAMLLRRLLVAEGKGPRDKIVLTAKDIEALGNMFGADDKADAALMPAIVYHPHGDVIELQILPMGEAHELARKQKQ